MNLAVGNFQQIYYMVTSKNIEYTSWAMDSDYLYIFFFSSFRSIDGLKYQIQNGLDQLEASRKVLLDQLLEIDRTMEKPKEEEIERVRYCHKCQVNGDGPLCVMCELDELFQVCYRKTVIFFFSSLSHVKVF